MSYPDITLTPRALLQQMMASTSNEDVALLSEFCRRFLLSGVTISTTGVLSGLQVALSGDGSGITGLNASALASGTVPLARLVNLTNTEIAAAAAIAWTKISKSGSSLADLATRSATDLTSGTLPDARFPAALPAISGAALTNLPSSLYTTILSTEASNQNNWAPATISGNTVIFWSGASSITVTGIAGLSSGQIVIIRNTGSSIISFAHNSGSSSAGNKLFNTMTGANTPVAPGGWVVYQHDGTQLRMVGHEQGAWITPTFSAGDYTANNSMTWTVGSGDVTCAAYRLVGRTLTFNITISGATVGGTPSSELIRTLFGFTSTKEIRGAYFALDASAADIGFFIVGAGATTIRFLKNGAGNWSSGSDNNYVYSGTLSVEVT